MAYPLLLHPLVLNQDVPTLGTELGLDEQTRLELRKELVGQLVTIEQEPRIGRPMRRRPGYEVLAECHSLTFDLRGRKTKPRLRIVFGLDPSVEGIHRVLVDAVGPRPNLEAYRRARARRQAGDWP